MDVFETVRQRQHDLLLSHRAEFQRIFGLDILRYVAPTVLGTICIDFRRLFEDIGIPMTSSSQEHMRRKYGQEAVVLIGKIILF